MTDMVPAQQKQTHEPTQCELELRAVVAAMRRVHDEVMAMGSWDTAKYWLALAKAALGAKPSNQQEGAEMPAPVVDGKVTLG